MNFVTFKGTQPIHACDAGFIPVCKQTDGTKARKMQQVIADAPTCKRCVAIIELRNKNSPAARTRRRHLAACQALRDGRAGAWHFEQRTSDAAARARFCNVLFLEIQALRFHARLLNPPA